MNRCLYLTPDKHCTYQSGRQREHQKVVDNELEVTRNFTWAVLGMEDGNFLHLGGVTRWNSQFFKIYMNFSRHHLCCFIVVPLFLLDKSMAQNRCLQQPCFKNLCKIAQASKNSESNAQHFLSDLLTHSRFHSMLFALPGYQLPYIVMNRCLYLRQLSSSSSSQVHKSPLIMSFVKRRAR